jgi:hypothetical protein
MMSTHWLTPLTVTGPVFLLVVVTAIVYGLRLRRSRKTTWEELMNRIVPVDRRAIETVALHTVDPAGQPVSDEERRELGRQDIWNLLGGMEGIRRIESNSAVLIEIAAYLERWHPEATDAAEELRLEAKKLEWHVGRLRAAEKNHCLDAHFHFYGRSAAVSYYLMSNRLLALYRQSHSSLFGDLQKAL